MKTLAGQLREHLNSISEAQFKEEWKIIEALGLQGPNAVEYASSFRFNEVLSYSEDNTFTTISKISDSFQGKPKASQAFNENFENEIAGNYQYAMAA